MNRLVRWASTLVVVLCIAFLIAFWRSNAAALPAIALPPGGLVGLVVAVVLYLVLLGAAAAAWRFALIGSGQQVGWGPATEIYFLSHLARYLPGNVGHLLGRVELARRLGIPTATTAWSLLFEIAGTVLGAGLTLAVFSPAIVGLDSRALKWVLLVALLACGVLAWVAVRLLGRRASGALRGPLPPGAGRTRRPVVWWSACVGLYALTFLLFGSMIWILARSVLAADRAALPTMLALGAAAWLAGFLTPGAPAGLGVREAVLLTALHPLHGPAVAFALPLWLRLATVVGDALAFLFGGALFLRRRAAAARTPASDAAPPGNS